MAHRLAQEAPLGSAARLGGADVVLRDGRTVHVRPAAPEDAPAVASLLASLSPASRAFRFNAAGADLAREAGRAVDGSAGLALVAEAGTRCVAHALLARSGPARGEVAFAIADDLQGRGLGTLLLGRLAEAAPALGIATFEAFVRPANERMIDVLRRSGFAVTARREDEWLVLELPAALGPEVLARFDERDQLAAAAAVGTVLRPRSVAVIGASRERGTIGGEVFHGLLARGFEGPVYPVNPNARVVQSVSAYAKVGDVPGDVDLAVVVVPARHVVGVARECAAKGVRALVVISAGFAETGPAGAARQRELVAVCRQAGMRLVGPNCMGVINTDPAVRLNATFAPIYPPEGRVAFVSQSGALGLAVIEQASLRRLGISTFVSVGNKADLSGNDLIQYWEGDPATDVILLYLESFGNPRKFGRIARRATRTKPIVAVKSGRSVAGARATGSHTGALVASSDVTVDALFEQAGVIRTTTLEEMFDVAALLATQPAPAGRRVAILTNAGGPAILCADACEALGLEVAPLPEEARRALTAFLPPEASTANPVDMIASASGEDYARAIGAIAACDAVDAIIVIFIPPLVTRAADVAAAIRGAVAAMPRRVPVASVFMSAQGMPEALRSDDVRIPSYPYPEDAARALAHAVRYAERRARPEGTLTRHADARPADAAAVLAAAVARGGGWLAPDEVARLFAAYGIPLVEQRIVAAEADVARAAEALGGPVALKVVAPGLVHKTEAGAVRLAVAPSAAEAVAAEMRAAALRAGHEVERFVVQRMVAKGVEMLVGVVHDPSFGPVVACGAGGTAVELLKDVSVRVAPLTDVDAREMVRSLRTFPLLDGYRGAPKADVGALEDVLLRVSAMADAHPEIVELDANPVIVLERGAVAVDARVRAGEPPPAPPVLGLSR